MDKYEELRKVLDKHLTGAPPSPAIDKILRELYTPAEVEVAVNMLFAPRPAEWISEKSGIAADEVTGCCESMANKGLVYARTKDGVMGYALLPTIPGVFEFPFMKGGGTEMHARLGKLWEEYHEDGMGDSFAGSETPLTRTIPVESALDAKSEVLPYEVISKMLEKNDTFALAQCACRVSVNGCDKPLDVCLVFDQTGRYLIERGHAVELTREQAMDVVKKAEDAGLVHTTNNAQDRLTLICNCCPCCCTILRGMTQLDNPHAFAKSRWLAQSDPELCSGCGVCEDERCPVEAIKVTDGKAKVDESRCIGCGLCVSACETEAISMKERPDFKEPAGTTPELGIKIMSEKGRLEEFIKMMGR